MGLSYVIGNVPRICVVFKVGGADTDPSGIVLIVRDPDGLETTATYGVGVVIVRDAVGRYHADVSAPKPGIWVYRWVGNGACAATVEDSFVVEPGELG